MKSEEGAGSESKSLVSEASYRAAVLKLYKSQVSENHDLRAKRNESVFPLPAFARTCLLQFIEDERDYIALEMLLNLFLTVPPVLTVFCIFPSNSLGLGLFLGRLALFTERFVLTLHVTSHRKLFKDEYSILNSFPETIGCFCMGIPPGSYHLHHVLMHHSENNRFPSDISSTMPHQRDSTLALLHYISKYFTLAAPYVLYYALTSRRYKTFVYSSVFYFGYFIASAFLYKFYPIQITWLVIVPYLTLGFLLMNGNFSQHVFVCPDQPFSNYRLAFNYINHADNQLTYNDGYHIVHHLNSRLHWSEIPQYFEDNVEKFAKNDAFVFSGVNNGGILNMVQKGNYDALFKHYVQLQPDNIRTKEQFEAECRRRLLPIRIKQTKEE